MNTNQFDVVVIGAGLGGVSVVAYLAKARKKVPVLEHHAVSSSTLTNFGTESIALK